MMHRQYGNGPFQAVVVHGGPGGPGDMAPMARELGKMLSVLEPMQSAMSVDGQVEELKDVIRDQCTGPVVLIGFSWGAFLSYLVAARYPELVRQLVLVSSGAFEASYAHDMTEVRLGRLPADEAEEARALLKVMKEETVDDMDAVFGRLGKLFSKADAYDPIPTDEGPMMCQFQVFKHVWPEAAELRRTGQLLEEGRKIQCPVVAIQGAYDTHQYEGVEKPLSGVLKDFKCIVLDKCGHQPWLEKQAKETFYEVLTNVIQVAN